MAFVKIDNNNFERVTLNLKPETHFISSSIGMGVTGSSYVSPFRSQTLKQELIYREQEDDSGNVELVIDAEASPKNILLELLANKDNLNEKLENYMNSVNASSEIIKNTKIIAIANKESIICAWNLISKELKKYNTQFIPVDSEHYSAWFSINRNKVNIKKIYLTASGGPFLKNKSKNKNNFTLSNALKHPNWKMGNKITIDSATLMNKVFEIIEAKNIFNIKYKDLKILTHPKSYIHSIIYYQNGVFDLIGHETSMKIPLINSLNFGENFNIKTSQLNLNVLNNLDFKYVDKKKFPLIKILNNLPKKLSLFETILVSLNDKLVELFLKKKITYFDLCKKLLKTTKLKSFKRFKKIQPKTIDEIINLSKYINTNFEKLMYKK